MFQGQTKDKLNNAEVTASVDNFVRSGLEAWLNANRTVADQIVGRIVLAARARLASREAISEVKRKSVADRRVLLPAKLPIAPRPGRMRRSCSWSRATRPAAAPNRAAITKSRRCCRCAARS